MFNNWKNWNIGDGVLYIYDDGFDGSGKIDCCVIAVEEDHALVKEIATITSTGKRIPVHGDPVVLYVDDTTCDDFVRTKNAGKVIVSCSNLHVGVQPSQTGGSSYVKRPSYYAGIDEYLFILRDTVCGMAKVNVTYDMLTDVGMSEEEAFEVAKGHTFATENAKSLSKVIAESFGDDSFIEEDDPLTVFMSGQPNTWGAGAMLDLARIREFGKQHHAETVWVLPCSVHEVLLVPEDDNLNVESLTGIVQSVNQQELRPNEILADQAFQVTC